MNAFEQLMFDRIRTVECGLARLRADTTLHSGRPHVARHERIAKMIGLAAALFQTTSAIIMGQSRIRNVVRARFAAMWAVYQTYGDSLPKIGREFGYRDHTTVLHALRRADELRRADAEFRKITDAMVARFTPKPVSDRPARLGRPGPAREEAENAPRNH